MVSLINQLSIDETYYLLTSQSQGFSVEQLKHTGLSATQLKKWIADIPTRKKLILLDTHMSDSVMQVNDLFMNEYKCKSGMILTAGRYTLSKAFRGHSIFTYGVIDALSGIADLNKNDFIESNELAQYIEAIVPAIAKYEFDRSQIPYIDQCGGDLQFKKMPRE